MTLRALYYRLVSAGHLPATGAGYNRLKRLMTRLREAGEGPVAGWLVDRVRSTLKPSSWSGLRLIEAGTDAKLTALWHGDVSGHDGDDSRADAALLEKLAWWMGGICEDRLDALFRRSKLYRAKWDRAAYRHLTFGFLAGVMKDFRRPKGHTA